MMKNNRSSRISSWLQLMLILNSYRCTLAFVKSYKRSHYVSSSRRPMDSIELRKVQIRRSNSERISSTSSIGAINFEGSGSSEINISLPSGATQERSLEAFLRCEESDCILLGSDNFRATGSSGNSKLYQVTQPSIEWFGSRLVSTFTNRIERPAKQSKIMISIVEAQTQVLSGNNTGGGLMSRIMQRSTFTGGTVLTWQISGNNYVLKADIQLNLSVDVPRFLPLPPGFNTIGSQIVSSTCKSRIQQNVKHIKDAYTKWALQKDYASQNFMAIDLISKSDEKRRRIKQGTLDAYLF